MAWNKIEITRDSGDKAVAQAPIIVSASRSTDIPAFYCDWFFNRLNKGYSAWTNPFNGVKSFVSYKDTRFIVFWSKNPRPLIEHLDYLDERGIGCYVQYTLNDYVEEGLEKSVPGVDRRIETFRQLAERLGKGHVVWRFDPMILTDKISPEDLLRKIEYIGDHIQDCNEKLIFSFADITSYTKVEKNLKSNGINYHDWQESEMAQFASSLAELNKKWGFCLATCGEKIDLKPYGVEKNRCVDDELITRLAYKDKILMDFLNMEIHHASMNIFGELDEPVPENAIWINEDTYAVRKRNNKDKGQRAYCECISSKDIGEYNTCPHQCEYCYANTSKASAIERYRKASLIKDSESITG